MNTFIIDARQKIKNYFKEIEESSVKILGKALDMLYIDNSNMEDLKSQLDQISEKTKVKENYDFTFDNIIITSCLNIENALSSLYPEEDRVYHRRLISYGLSDSISQVIEKYGQDHLITLYPVFRKSEPNNQGFRFHKWGPYIGIYQETVDNYEYLYDTDLYLIWIYEVHDTPKNYK